MKKRDLLKSSTILFFILLLISSCKKDTPATKPILSTIQPSSITDSTAISGGNVTSDGSEIIISRGVCWNTSPNPYTDNAKTEDGTGSGEFTSKLTGLKPGITYHVRAYAKNAVETAYGNDISFTTNALLPIITTTEITAIEITTATSGNTITFNGGAAITASGICWSIKQMPTIADSTTKNESTTEPAVSHLTKLLPNTTYYVRAYATNSVGTAYGNEVSFKTKDCAVDIDGNIYPAVTIGTQTWLQDNLRVTKYRNGDVIGTTSKYFNISSESMPKYQWPIEGEEGLLNNYVDFGRLYTWYAATDSRNICPVGWHIPSVEEWTTLETYLIANGYNYDGSTTDNKIAISLAYNGYWNYNGPTVKFDNTTIGLNSTKFDGIATGIRYSSASNNYYEWVGNVAYWWSGTESDVKTAWYKVLGQTTYVFGSSNFYDKSSGMSVRCVKD